MPNNKRKARERWRWQKDDWAALCWLNYPNPHNNHPYNYRCPIVDEIFYFSLIQLGILRPLARGFSGLLSSNRLLVLPRWSCCGLDVACVGRYVSRCSAVFWQVQPSSTYHNMKPFTTTWASWGWLRILFSAFSLRMFLARWERTGLSAYVGTSNKQKMYPKYTRIIVCTFGRKFQYWK